MPKNKFNNKKILKANKFAAQGHSFSQSWSGCLPTPTLSVALSFQLLHFAYIMEKFLLFGRRKWFFIPSDSGKEKENWTRAAGSNKRMFITADGPSTRDNAIIKHDTLLLPLCLLFGFYWTTRILHMLGKCTF